MTWLRFSTIEKSTSKSSIFTVQNDRAQTGINLMWRRLQTLFHRRSWPQNVNILYRMNELDFLNNVSQMKVLYKWYCFYKIKRNISTLTYMCNFHSKKPCCINWEHSAGTNQHSHKKKYELQNINQRHYIATLFELLKLLRETATLPDRSKPLSIVGEMSCVDKYR